MIDPRRPFGDRAEKGGKVDFLKAFAVPHARIDVADEQDHRLRILPRDMDADAGIGRPGAARHEGHAGPTGHRPLGTGHERRTAFLAAGHHIDRILLRQSVEDLQEAFAGDGEDTFAPLFDQAIDQQAGGGRGGGRAHAARVPRGVAAGNRDDEGGG